MHAHRILLPFLLLMLAFACDDGDQSTSLSDSDSMDNMTPADIDEQADGDSNGDGDMNSDGDEIAPIYEGPFLGVAPEKKPAEVVTTSPANNDVLIETPSDVSILFNTALPAGASVQVYRNKEKIADSDILTENDTVLSASLPETAGIGVYDVIYTFLSNNEEVQGYFVFFVELDKYEDQQLDSILDFRENSIAGPQYVPMENYQLQIDGLVDQPTDYSYDEVLANSHFKEVMELHCVEGWRANVLWEGVRLDTLIEASKPQPEAVTVIFHCYDGYTTSVPLSYVMEYKPLLAFNMNGIALPAMRGFPFQLAAYEKWGYKWAKWVTRIELSDDEQYRGYWENVGYNNDGSEDGPIFDRNKKRITNSCTVKVKTER